MAINYVPALAGPEPKMEDFNMARGSLEMLSCETAREARVLLGHDLTLRELRLLPFIDYCCKNSCFKRICISMEEKAVIEDWEAMDLLRAGDSVKVSQRFYSFMCHALWDAYVEVLPI
jgi:hypothetical protein